MKMCKKKTLKKHAIHYHLQESMQFAIKTNTYFNIIIEINIENLLMYVGVGLIIDQLQK